MNKLRFTAQGRDGENRFKKAALVSAAFLYSLSAQAADINSTPDASHYAFANYLGSGLYRTAGQEAAVANIPISLVVDEAEDHLMKLRLPLSLGFFNYSFEDLPGGELPDAVGTMTLTPGIEYHWFINQQTRLETYLDLGYGHNFTNSSNVGIISSGTAIIHQFEQARFSPIWATRVYWAGYKSSLNDSSDSFAVFQTGLDVGLGYQWQWGTVEVEPRVFASGKWFFDTLTFLNPDGEDIYTNHTYEMGASLKFSKPVGWDVFGWDGLKIDRLGLSYQSGGGLKVWRLIFEFPL